MRKGIEGARNTHWYDTEGKELLEAPPAFVDMEAGFGGPTQTFTLATELIRVGAGGRAPGEPGSRPTAPAATS